MRARLYWIAAGGLSFWLPEVVVTVALGEHVNLWVLNIVPLAGVTLLGVATWFGTQRAPRWGWVLAGIYILGPVSMFARTALLHVPSSPNVQGGNMWIILFCLFPPMTLWIALLNGIIFAVLAVTVILLLLAAYPNGRRLPPNSSFPQ